MDVWGGKGWGGSDGFFLEVFGGVGWGGLGGAAGLDFVYGGWVYSSIMGVYGVGRFRGGSEGPYK